MSENKIKAHQLALDGEGCPFAAISIIDLAQSVVDAFGSDMIDKEIREVPFALSMTASTEFLDEALCVPAALLAQKLVELSAHKIAGVQGQAES